MNYFFEYTDQGVTRNLTVEAKEVDFTIEASELSIWGAVGVRTYNAFGTIPGSTSTTKYYYQSKTGGGSPYTSWAFLPSRISEGLGPSVDWDDTKYQLVNGTGMKFWGNSFAENSYKKLRSRSGHCFLNFGMKTDYEGGQPVTRFVNQGFCLFDPLSYETDTGLVAPSGATSEPLTYDTRWRAPNLFFMKCKLHDDIQSSETYGSSFDIIVILRSCDDRYTPGSSYSEVLFIDERLFGDTSPNPVPPAADPKKNSTPTGWRGTRNTASSSDEPTTEPQALKYNGANWGTDHGIFLYKISPTQLVNLTAALWSKNFVDIFLNSKFSPATCILSLHKLPYAPEVSNPNIQTVRAGGIELNIREAKYIAATGQIHPVYDIVAVEAYKIYAGQHRESKTVDIQPFFNSFLDFEPYTQVHIRIPFVGLVKIPTSTVMGGKVKVNFVFDNRNGNFTCQVLAKSFRNRETADADGFMIIGQYTGCCAMPSALTGNTNGGTATVGAITGFASSAVQGGVSIATGNVAGGAAQIATGALKAVGDWAMAPHQTQLIGTVNAEAAVLQDTTVRVLITRPVDVTPGKFNTDGSFEGDALIEQKGLAAYSGSKVEDYSGMTAGYILGNIEGATAEEMLAIRNAFLGGVII